MTGRRLSTLATAANGAGCKAACGQKAGVGDPEGAAAPLSPLRGHGPHDGHCERGQPDPEVQSADRDDGDHCGGLLSDDALRPCLRGPPFVPGRPVSVSSAAGPSGSAAAAAGDRPGRRPPPRPPGPTPPSTAPPVPEPASVRSARPRRRHRQGDRDRPPRTDHRGGARPPGQRRQGQGPLLQVPGRAGRDLRPQRADRVPRRSVQPVPGRGGLPGDGGAGARLHARRHRHRPDHLLRPSRRPGGRPRLRHGRQRDGRGRAEDLLRVVA